MEFYQLTLAVLPEIKQLVNVAVLSLWSTYATPPDYKKTKEKVQKQKEKSEMSKHFSHGENQEDIYMGI